MLGTLAGAMRFAHVPHAAEAPVVVSTGAPKPRAGPSRPVPTRRRTALRDKIRAILPPLNLAGLQHHFEGDDMRVACCVARLNGHTYCNDYSKYADMLLPWGRAASGLRRLLLLMWHGGAGGANGYGGCDPVLPTHAPPAAGPASRGALAQLRKRVLRPGLAAAVGAAVVLGLDGVFYGGSLASLRKLN